MRLCLGPLSARPLGVNGTDGIYSSTVWQGSRLLAKAGDGVTDLEEGKREVELKSSPGI